MIFTDPSESRLIDAMRRPFERSEESLPCLLLVCLRMSVVKSSGPPIEDSVSCPRFRCLKLSLLRLMLSTMLSVKSSGPPKEEVVTSRASFRVELPIEAWDVMRDAIAGSEEFGLWYLASRAIESGMRRAPVCLGSGLIVVSTMLRTRCRHSLFLWTAEMNKSTLGCDLVIAQIDPYR